MLISSNRSRVFPQLQGMRFLLQMVTERDKALRSAVLGTLAVLYQQEGEATVWAQCGRLSDQQRSLIEVREYSDRTHPLPVFLRPPR